MARQRPSNAMKRKENLERATRLDVVGKLPITQTNVMVMMMMMMIERCRAISKRRQKSRGRKWRLLHLLCLQTFLLVIRLLTVLLASLPSQRSLLLTIALAISMGFLAGRLCGAVVWARQLWEITVDPFSATMVSHFLDPHMVLHCMRSTNIESCPIQ